MDDGMSHTSMMCPSMAILSNWSDRNWEESDGLQVETREDLERILVRTYNSVYELIVQSGAKGEVLVRGGLFFPSFTRVHLAGSSFGGSFLKRLGIYVGLRMELFREGETIITSPVTAISVCPFERSFGGSASH